MRAPVTVCVAFVIGCGKSDVPPAKGDSTAAKPAAVVAAPADPKCPATGLWAECSALYRLERAGLAPRVDSAATPAEKSLAVHPLVIKIEPRAVCLSRFDGAHRGREEAGPHAVDRARSDADDQAGAAADRERQPDRTADEPERAPARARG